MTRKHIMISLLALALSTNVMAQRDWAGLNRYTKDNAALPALQKGEKRVVFLGNSITEGWVNHHPNFFKDNGYIGRGISGHTSYQFVVRFRQDVINLKPHVVVISAGTNDCAENTDPFDVDRTMDNIITMTEQARQHGIHVILCSVTPSDKFGWNNNIKDPAERIAKLNARIKAYAEANKIPYADYFTAMENGTTHGMKAGYSNDAVHPTAEGYDAMEAVIKPIVDKVLKLGKAKPLKY